MGNELEVIGVDKVEPSIQLAVYDNSKQTQQSPINVMMVAIEKGLDLEKIEKMMELQERFEANEAKKSFVVAMAGFKKVPLVITKDKENKQYNSRYTSIGNIVNTALPAMSSHGLSHKWDICQSELIKVTCVVTHAMGHSESVSMEAPADKSGAKNAIQQIKSTITYLKLATFESIMGVASSDKAADDDGNAYGVACISEKQAAQITDMMSSKNINHEDFICRHLGLESIETMPSKMFSRAMGDLKLAGSEAN